MPMARIAESEIERLKREISVQRLAEARGVKLKRHGADLIGLCPFHDDHEPSLVITPGKNLWNCLGACRKGGTVIDWVMRAEGVSFRHAVELLREDHLPLAADRCFITSSMRKENGTSGVDQAPQATRPRPACFFSGCTRQGSTSENIWQK
jgi:DNA primase